MASNGYFHRIIVGLFIGLMSIGALFSLAVPASAAMLFPPDPGACLQLDSMAHEVTLNAVEPNLSCAVAFEQRALEHDLFNGDHFGFGRTDPRL